MHDIYRVGHEPSRFTDATQRIGTAAIPCDFRKIAAIVVTNDPGGCPVLKSRTVSAAIGANIISFLKEEVAAGRQPASLSPIQSGRGQRGQCCTGRSGEAAALPACACIPKSYRTLRWS